MSNGEMADRTEKAPSGLKVEADVDVVVVGGGPAGTTAAALLAEQGFKVVLYEKDRHPRFHIGESLLPASLPILERLGVLEEVRNMALYKPGADFTCEDGTIQAFPFARALGDTPAHAFQVRRADFDELLFNNAVRRGVATYQQHKVTRVYPCGDGHQLEVEPPDGNCFTVTCRLLIDASGRDALVARQEKWQVNNKRHASAAVFAHFENVVPRSGELTGNISVYWFTYGWVWMIPLTGGVMSVGAVCSPAFLKTRSCDLESFLRSISTQIPDAAERMENAVLCSEVNATGNYSYRSTQLYRPGLLLVGDAYAFIDPVFSSGVYLAMCGACESVEPAKAWLAGEKTVFTRLAKHYQRTMASRIAAFSWFIYRFATPTMLGLFRNPRNDWQVEQAVISMLAGDGDGSADIRQRIRVFRTIYYLSWIRHLPRSIRSWWRRRRDQQAIFKDETILS